MDGSLSSPAVRRRGLSASTLKIIACVAMFIDHMGLHLFPDIVLFRAIGRLAFPLFAFFIAQGCRYTRNKSKRFWLVFGLGAVCEGVYFLYSGVWDGNVLLTFSCSIPLIYTIQGIKAGLAQRAVRRTCLFTLGFGCMLVFSIWIVRILPLDYGLFGILLPAFAVLPDYREGEAPDWLEKADRPIWRLLLFFGGMALQWAFSDRQPLRLFAFLALVPLAFYNGQPGKKGWKYGFYLFYPAHLLLIALIGWMLERH